MTASTLQISHESNMATLTGAVVTMQRPAPDTTTCVVCNLSLCSLVVTPSYPCVTHQAQTALRPSDSSVAVMILADLERCRIWNLDAING
jgi:hypothetical protein